jgi:MFS family permease
MMPAAAVISHWLIRSRGAAMGIVSAGSSPSVVLFYPLNAWLITSSGWRQALDAYILLGIGPLGPRNAPVLRQPLTARSWGLRHDSLQRWPCPIYSQRSAWRPPS